MRPDRRGRATLAVVALAGALTVVAALPASAHTTLPDAPYYTSIVRSISPPVPGLTITLTRSGESVTLTNKTGSTVTVLGYDGEQYLRISPTGVDENTNSLSAFLNGSLVIDSLPQQLGATPPDRAPAWHHVSDTAAYTWHDHRVHWMAQQRPPVVAADPGSPHHVLDWAIDLRVAQRPVTVTGSLDWTGAPILTGLPLVLLIGVSVATGLGLTVALLRLHLSRRAARRSAAAGLALPALDDELLPREPARSPLTDR